MERGYYRIRLDAADKDWITLYVPLTEDGRYDPAAPKPHLLKCSWDGEELLGEFVAEHVKGNKYNRIIWSNTSDSDSLTDFLTTPIKLASQCYVYEGDSPATDEFTFRVRSMTRL